MVPPTQKLTFRGSTSTVTEFIGFAIYTILHQRSVYPSSAFKEVTRYGIPLMISTDNDLNAYIAEALQQVAAWVTADTLRKVVLIVTDAAGETVFERWAFDILPRDTEKEFNVRRTENEFHREMRVMISQIVAAVLELPPLGKNLSFDLLMYTERDAEAPSEFWEKGEPQQIPNSSAVELRSFDTGFHHLNAFVTYRGETV